MSGIPDLLDNPVIDFITNAEGHRGTPADIEISKQIEAATNENIKRVEDRLESMRRLHEITKDIVSHLDTKEVIDSILHAAAQGLGATGVDLLLRDCATGGWIVFASHNKLFRYTGMVQALEEFGPSMATVLEGKTVIMNDFGSWLAAKTDYLTSIKTQEEREYWLSSICIASPLWRDNQVYGLVSVTDIGSSRKFTGNDADYLALFSGVASVAFTNADMYSRIRHLNESLEERVEERTLLLQQLNEELGDKTQQLDRALAATVRLQEEERERIANELHDTSCQMVAGALFELQAAQESLAAGNSEVTSEKLATAMRVIRDLDTANRSVMEAAYPSQLSNRGLANTLPNAVNRLNAQFGGNCVFRVEGNPVRLSKQEELALFRIAHEGVANALKHAKATTVMLALVFEKERVLLSIEDDGRGFVHTDASSTLVPHRGLAGIHDRAAAINARLTIESRLSVGTCISVVVPLSESSASGT